MPYEIRIIGKNHFAAEGFANVTCVGKGGKLNRQEMEDQAVDIDAFLILYDRTKYRLTCSGAIFESLSLMKPIVHFDNECIDQFNTVECPIGFCCGSFDEYVSKLEDIVNNYDSYKTIFLKYRENIWRLRQTFAIENSVVPLRDSFNWRHHSPVNEWGV